MQDSKSWRQRLSLRLYAETACSVIVEIAEHADGDLPAAMVIPVGVDVKDRPVRLHQPHADRLDERRPRKTNSGAMRTGRKGSAMAWVSVS